MRRITVLAGLGGAALAVALAACSSSSTTTAAAPGTSAPAASAASAPATSASASAKPSGTLVVFAATSLTDAFNKIGTQFQQANPGVTVKFNYNGSSSLATQITQGAPADVFASASPTNMKTVTAQSLASTTP